MNSLPKSLFFPDVVAQSPQAWEDAGKASALALFRKASAEVPAYKQFLAEKAVDPASITDWEGFRTLPPVSKKGYLKQAAFKDLLWGGSFSKPSTFTATSGSTGEPTYFTRSYDVDAHAAAIHEHFYRSSVANSEEPTLVVVCFGMGIWIGGLITYQAFRTLGEAGYPVSVITPGVNKPETFKALRKLAPHFKQIILAGYPPFLKDILDEAESEGISFGHASVSLLFAAEGFSESFRDHLAEKAGISNPILGSMNIYGTADIGAMAFETPLSILVRRLAINRPSLYERLFSKAGKLPTFAQYVPTQVLFEEVDGELYLTGDSAMPLIRYAIGDNGGVRSYMEVETALKEEGFSFADELAKAGVSSEHLLKLPFVYVFERNDFSATLYGLQVFPETIREVLIQKPWGDSLTGKLALRTAYDGTEDQYLEVNIELRKGLGNPSGTDQQSLVAEIVRVLREKNAEFRELSDHLGPRANPRLIFWPAEDATFFRPGIKQKWVVS